MLYGKQRKIFSDYHFSYTGGGGGGGGGGVGNNTSTVVNRIQCMIQYVRN